MLVPGSLFFATWDPQNRYHKLFRPQNDSVLGFQTGLKTKSHFGSSFFSSFSRFSGFIHTIRSASRKAPAISRPRFRLSSALLFLLSFRPPFRRLFGYKTVVKTDPKTESETGPLNKARPSEKQNPVFQKGVRNGTPKGGGLWSARLFYVVSLFFW